jgi:hypothetical protein
MINHLFQYERVKTAFSCKALRLLCRVRLRVSDVITRVTFAAINKAFIWFPYEHRA